MRKMLIGLVMGCCAAVVLSGCALPCAANKSGTVTSVPAPAPAPRVAAGQATMVYPSVCDTCGVLRVDKTIPAQVAVNETIDYQIKVTNIGGVPVDDVVITDIIPAGFKVTSTSPKGNIDAAGNATWDLGALGPGESKVITVSGSATKVGTFDFCGHAKYVLPNCVSTTVVEPALKLTAQGPAKVIQCDEIPLKFEVCNPGSGPARGVVVKASLPAGLTVDGASSVTFPAKTLQPGQCEELAVTAKASKTGTYTVKASAQGKGNLQADSNAVTVKVTKPALKIAKKGPKKVYLYRTFTDQITVTNTGDAVSANTVVTDTLPANATFKSASAGGVSSGTTVAWSLGALAPNESKTVSVELLADKIGTVKNTATAKGDCAAAVTASAATDVLGIPAILLEVIDVEDPIEIGGTATYVITATNQGSATDTNVTIVCTLEDNQQYVSSSGATVATVSGATVKFAPLPSLAAKAKAQWKLIVKAVKPGDVRFKVTMNTDQLTRPVEETEATHLYK